MPKSIGFVNSRGARRQSPAELEGRILEARRAAVHRHLSPAEWAAIDRMRNWHAKLLKEAAL